MKANTKNLTKLNKNLIKFVFIRKGYSINAEQGIIECTLTGRLKVKLESVSNKDVNFSLYTLINKEFNTPDLKFTGCAKCSNSDKFNELVGKRIAEGKAKYKVYKYMEKLLEESAKNTLEAFEMLCDSRRYYKLLSDLEVNHTKELDVINNKNNNQ